MTEEHTLRPDFYVVCIPHNLEHWNLPGDIDKIESIETTYLFDKNVHVHCCEITPSYELHPIETRINLKPEFDTEAERERFDEIARDNHDTDVKYRHVAAMVDWLSPEHEGKKFKHLGDTGVDPKTKQPTPYDDVSYDEQRDATIEHCQCNQQL